ncbi:MAG: hypothetical protein CM15mP125_1930 [Gammaproteobacteria bacterium]|nr:MAG: hypothetical protein CM15mP125_1930 [Gammaproteobacteria bacterium]
MTSPADVANPLLFFFMVITLFPLGLGPDPARLATLAPGILWVVALLASLMVSAKLFASDFEDGSLEQLALAPYPLASRRSPRSPPIGSRPDFCWPWCHRSLV